MHAVMMGSHNSHEGKESVTTVQEVRSGDMTLAVTAPPMEVNRESTIEVSLKSGKRISDSTSIHFMIVKSAADGATDQHSHDTMDDTSDFRPIHKTIFISNGSASIAFTPTNAGRFILAIDAAIDSVTVSSELNFIVQNKKSRGMMGMGAVWDYPIVGVLAMGAMMITMWAIRGGI